MSLMMRVVKEAQRGDAKLNLSITKLSFVYSALLKLSKQFNLPESSVARHGLDDTLADIESISQALVRGEGTQLRETGYLLSERSLNSLERAKIFTVEDLTYMTRTQVRRLKGLGAKCVVEIEQMLASEGKQFRRQD